MAKLPLADLLRGPCSKIYIVYGRDLVKKKHLQNCCGLFGFNRGKQANCFVVIVVVVVVASGSIFLIIIIGFCDYSVNTIKIEQDS
jgi:hypothetical protein